MSIFDQQIEKSLTNTKIQNIDHEMKTRTELENLSNNILVATITCNKEQIVKVGGEGIEIEKFNQVILDSMKSYLSQERSLKGRFQTLQQLKNSVQILTQNQSGSCAETLLPSILKIDEFIQQTTELQNEIESKTSGNVRDEVKELIDDFLSSTTRKIKDNAFRTVRDLNDIEGYLVSTFLKGSAPLTAFMSLKADMEVFLTTYEKTLSNKQKTQIQEAIFLLNAAETRSRAIFELSLFEQKNGFLNPDVHERKLADISYDIETSINQLEIGKSVLIPGGYSRIDNKGKTSAHAIVYQIQRVRDKEYHFSIFNTGAGSEFGQDLQTKSSESNQNVNQSRVPLFIGLPKEAVMDQSFLMDLIRYQTKISLLPQNAMQPIHEKIEIHLTKKHSGIKTLREPHDLQTWGTCTFDSVAAFLEYQLPPSLYIPFKFDMMLRARIALHSLIPQGKEEKLFVELPYPYPQVLDSLDKKSCDSIVDWKEKFKRYCEPQGDLLIARDLIEGLGIKNEEELVRYLEHLSDLAFELDRLAQRDEERDIVVLTTGLIMTSIMAPLIIPFMIFIPASIPLTIALGAGIGAGTGVGLGMTAEGYQHLSGHVGQSRTDRDKAAKYLELIESILAKISPEQIEILKKRLQSLHPSTSAWDTVFPELENPPVLEELNLQGMLSYLQQRFEEIALCAPLLNTPLQQETLQGCNMLTVTTTNS